MYILLESLYLVLISVHSRSYLGKSSGPQLLSKCNFKADTEKQVMGELVCIKTYGKFNSFDINENCL